ncbi:hypothetical protein [Prevotella sp.]|uniref:hypothetical protein n=1 Tax=Prevotella sp. TaxID=59823 RepID=UPI004029B0C5
MNYNRQGKHRRLWRLAVATQPSIADYYISQRRVPRGHVSIRNSIYWSFVGAWLRRDAIAS